MMETRTETCYIKISDSALDRDDCLEFVSSANSGGTVLFDGTVRDNTRGKEVLRLEFEAYESMALSEMRKIGQQALERFAIHRMSIHHRTGSLVPGESAVIIAVASAHRDAAFDACRFAIDTLKETVPIWKKEIFRDGSIWVAAHP